MVRRLGVFQVGQPLGLGLAEPGDLALCAFRALQVGERQADEMVAIDLERRRPDQDWDPAPLLSTRSNSSVAPGPPGPARRSCPSVATSSARNSRAADPTPTRSGMRAARPSDGSHRGLCHSDDDRRGSVAHVLDEDAVGPVRGREREHALSGGLQTSRDPPGRSPAQKRRQGRAPVGPAEVGMLPRCTGSLRFRRAHDAAKADVARRRVDRLALAGGGAVAQAVVRCAQVRAALDHAARDVRARLPATRLASASHARVARRAAGRRRGVGVPGGEEVATSTPRRCRSCRTGRSRWAGTRRPARCRRSRPARGSATGTRPARCWPSGARPGANSSPHANTAPSRPPRAARSHSASVGSALPAHAA